MLLSSCPVDNQQRDVLPMALYCIWKIYIGIFGKFYSYNFFKTFNPGHQNIKYLTNTILISPLIYYLVVELLKNLYLQMSVSDISMTKYEVTTSYTALLSLNCPWAYQDSCKHLSNQPWVGSRGSRNYSTYTQYMFKKVKY